MLNKVKSLKYVQRLADLGERSCNTMLLALKLYFFTSISNKSHFFISFLFHQRRMPRDGRFFVYICNARRVEYRKWEVRVHTCRQPCAHGRRSFFRHTAIGCAHAQ